MNLTIMDGQDILDIVVNRYGTIDLLFDLLADNSLDINSTLLAGQILEVDEKKIRPVQQQGSAAKFSQPKIVATAFDGQNLLDLALQYYGSVEGLFDLLNENKQLSINSVLNPGQLLQVKAEVTRNKKKSLVVYFDSIGYIINTGDPAGKGKQKGIGYWTISKDFVTQ